MRLYTFIITGLLTLSKGVAESSFANAAEKNEETKKLL